jgi:hypothetical protein
MYRYKKRQGKGTKVFYISGARDESTAKTSSTGTPSMESKKGGSKEYKNHTRDLNSGPHKCPTGS